MGDEEVRCLLSVCCQKEKENAAQKRTTIICHGLHQIVSAFCLLKTQFSFLSILKSFFQSKYFNSSFLSLILRKTKRVRRMTYFAHPFIDPTKTYPLSLFFPLQHLIPYLFTYQLLEHYPYTTPTIIYDLHFFCINRIYEET